MVVVPEFLIRRIYKKGSLKKIENGASLDLKNVLGPGFISGFNYVKINDVVYDAENVKFVTGGKEYTSKDVSDSNPLAFRLGQEGTLIMTGQECIVDGLNKIIIEAMNPEAGQVVLSVEDNLIS